MLSTDKDSRVYHLKGILCEKYINSKLRDEGFKVRKVAKRGFDYENDIFDKFVYLNRKGLKDIFGDTKNLSRFKKAELAKFLYKNLKGIPDFICLKNGKISFVEVKSLNAGLTEEQKKVFYRLGRLGYHVIVRRVKINFSINEV